MDKLSVESDTKRGTFQITTKTVINKIRKDYKSLIKKIITINGIIIVIVIIIIILIKFLVLNKKRQAVQKDFFIQMMKIINNPVIHVI